MPIKFLLDLLNIKPKESIIEFKIGNVLSLKKDCEDRQIRHRIFTKKYKDLDEAKVLLIIIEFGSKVKPLREKLNLIKSNNFSQNTYFILDCSKLKKNFIKNNFILIKYLLSFKINSMPHIVFLSKKQYVANIIVPDYPTYLNKNKYNLFKLWSKQIILILNCIIKSQYRYIIYKVKLI
jgi:hypothetical protein